MHIIRLEVHHHVVMLIALAKFYSDTFLEERYYPSKEHILLFKTELSSNCLLRDPQLRGNYRSTLHHPVHTHGPQETVQKWLLFSIQLRVICNIL